MLRTFRRFGHLRETLLCNVKKEAEGDFCSSVVESPELSPGLAQLSQSLKESKEEVARILKVQHRSEGQQVDGLDGQLEEGPKS